MDLPTVTFPPSTAHTHTIIFLHGRGDNAPDFSKSIRLWRDSQNRSLLALFPSIRFVFPQTNLRPSARFPRQTLHQWFDVWNTDDFSEREELQAEGLRESVGSIRRILENEAAALGGMWDRVILAGISQGAATSMHTFLNLDIPPPHRLGAVMGFSCRMPFPGRTLPQTRQVLDLDNLPTHDNLLRNTPVLLEHCIDDPLVLVKNGRGLRDTLRGFGVQVSWKEYSDGGHWFNAPAGLDDVAAFLRQVLGGSLDVGHVSSPQAQALSGEMDLS